MPQVLSVCLFGVISIRLADRSLTEKLSGRQQELIAYLVLNREVPQSRQRLSFQLWPDLTDDRSRANLRKELSRLRKALPDADEFIRVTAKTLQWNSESQFTLDVADFEKIAKKANQSTSEELEKAIALYRAELLSDFDYEWVFPERDRLHHMYGQVIGKLIDRLEAQRDYSAAVIYAQQLLRDDPLNEGAYYALMRLYRLMGDRASGLRTYHQCMTTLREELGVDPNTTTSQLYEQLLHEDEIPLSRDAPPLPTKQFNAAPLIGRDQEWASIYKWITPLLTSSGKAISEVLLLVGEPGIGKTRLLEELAMTAQNERTQMLWGASFAAETTRPYGFWIDALRSGDVATADNSHDALGALLPELGQPTSTLSDPSHLYDAVVNLLNQWATSAPLLLLLDDIQWLDEASSALLNYVIRVTRHAPIGFACTARPGELATSAAIARVLQALRKEHRLSTLEIHPLTQVQTMDLMQSTGQVDPSEISADIAHLMYLNSGGNPLLTLEMARSWESNQPHPTVTLSALITDRLHQLDDTTREFLPWAAALGRSFQPSIVAYVADYPLPQLLTVVETLEQQSIIRPSIAMSESGYDFTHDVLRQVVYQQLSPPRRQLIHQQIARKLDEQSTQDEALSCIIAHHAALANDHALATSSMITAAERCLKLFAYNEAMKLAQQGIHHCQFLEKQAQLLSHAKFLRICASSGLAGDDSEQAEQEAQQLIQTAKALQFTEAEALALEALMLLQFGRDDFSKVHEHSVQAAEVSRVANPATIARILACSGSCLAEIGREMDRAEALLLEAQTLAGRMAIVDGDVTSGLGCIHRHHGRYEEARVQLQQSWKLAQAQQDHWRECACLTYLAMTELESGNPQDALPYCDQIRKVASQIQGEGSEGAISNALVALAHYQLGEAQSAFEMEQAVNALQHLDAKRILAYVLTGAAAIDLKQNLHDQAVNRAKLAMTYAQTVNHPSDIARSWAILIQGLFASGNPQQARSEYEEQHSKINYQQLSHSAQAAVDQIQYHP